VYPDLAWDYPFFGGDGLEWLISGLWLGGEDVACVGRQPLLPAALALLDRLGLLRFAPLVAQLAALGLVLASYRLVRRRFPPGIALACGAWVLALHALTWMSLELMADVIAVLLVTIALDAWLEPSAGARPGAHAAGAAAGLAQTGAALLLAPVVLVRGGWRRGLFGLATLVVPLGAWIAAQRIADCSPLIAQGQRWRFAFHLDALDDYGALALAFLGWPALAVCGIGALRAIAALRTAEGRRRWAPVLACLAAFVLFFILGYRFRALRLVAYALPALLLLFAAGLERLARPAVRAAAIAAVLAAGAWPQAGLFDVRWVLWPLPPLEVTAAVDELEPSPAPLRLAIERPAPGAVLARAAPLRVRTARRALTASARPTVTGAREVLLFAEDLSPERRRDLQLRWMATLRGRVRLAPRGLYPDAVGDWVPPPPDLSPELRAAGAAIQEMLDGEDGLLGAVRDPEGSDDALWRTVPFVVRTTNLFFLTPSQAQPLRAPSAGTGREIGPWAVEPTTFRGRPVILVAVAR
jgi:hypothetical protein